MFHLLLLPFRVALWLVVGVVLLPVLLVWFGLKLLVSLVLLPFKIAFALLGLVLMALALGVLFFVPLLPVLLLVLLVWVLARTSWRMLHAV